jgi:hypothetical protein
MSPRGDDLFNVLAKALIFLEFRDNGLERRSTCLIAFNGVSWALLLDPFGSSSGLLQRSCDTPQQLVQFSVGDRPAL